MKKNIILCVVLAFLASGVFAQKTPPAKPEAVTVNGSLALVNGRIALRSSDFVYYVGGIQQLIGFVDGLKEGAQVSLEGYSRSFSRNQETVNFLWVSKLIIAGKTYDLAPAENDRRAFPGRQRMPMGPGMMRPNRQDQRRR